MRATIVPSLIICPKCGMVLTWNKPLPWETRRPLSLELECSYNYDGIPKGAWDVRGFWNLDRYHQATCHE